MVRPRRAWIYALTITALLVPAGGIAYLGAVSYRDERGAIAAQDERQRQAAAGIASRITRAIDETLDAIERAVVVVESDGTTRPTIEMPLGAHWFWLEDDGRMRVPRTGGEPTSSAGLLDRSAPCAAGARLEDCVRELSTRQIRVARLHAAQRAETCKGDACAPSLADAKRHYTALAAFADTGPAALLGLARVQQRLGDTASATEALGELEQRFADRAFDGIPVSLVVALLRASTTAARLEVASDVVANKYALAPTDRVGVLSRIRALVPEAERRAIEADITRIRTEARAAAGLLEDVPEILRTATSAWRVRTAPREPARTLIFRRRADGGVLGMAVDASTLRAVAGSDAADSVATNAQVLVLPAGATPPPSLRSIVQVPLGEALPHLALAIVNPISDPDPRDAVIRERSKRHVLYTSALAIALGAGIILIIRAAARQRELAQLKSDFVSTVSHELKTPLTSIRMFAEMLEQGVAQGDPAKMARYHGVIVQESQRLGLLIANLLDYAQIEKGTRRYTPSRHEVGQLARLAVTTFETLRDPEATSGATGARNSIEVAVSSEAAHAEVEVDRDVVVQAVLNLLANAAKYGGADKQIEVTVGADTTHAFIAVRDHGPGIPPSEQPRIFREFYRSPEAYRSGVEGTGLGLALVKRHIEALGGTVEVASVVGQGATFTLRFPRVGLVTEVAA
ncbi:MAG: sensor histidine kinase [Kofleriaceae bacterium]